MHGDRELDLIAQAESAQLSVQNPQWDQTSTRLLYGVLCATTAIARLLYNETGGDGGPNPPIEDVPAECPQCRAPDSNRAHRRVCQGPVQFDVHGARMTP